MAYTPTWFEPGQVMTPGFAVPEFNKIENGVAALHSAVPVSVSNINNFINAQKPQYMAVNGSTQMTGALYFNGARGVKLKDSFVGLTPQNPNITSLNTPSGGNVYVNGERIWADNYNGFAMYYATGTYRDPNYQNLVRFDNITGFDTSGGTGAMKTGDGRFFLFDAGNYIATLTANINGSATNSARMYITHNTDTTATNSSVYYLNENAGSFPQTASITYSFNSPTPYSAIGALILGNLSLQNVQLTVIRVP